jgi:hypothetical protein
MKAPDFSSTQPLRMVKYSFKVVHSLALLHWPSAALPAVALFRKFLRPTQESKAASQKRQKRNPEAGFLKS